MLLQCAQNRFARKRCFDKRRWTPIEDLETTITLTAWGVKSDDKRKVDGTQPRKLHAVSKKNEVKGEYTSQQGQSLALHSWQVDIWPVGSLILPSREGLQE
jgi:hypothetical protein